MNSKQSDIFYKLLKVMNETVKQDVAKHHVNFYDLDNQLRQLPNSMNIILGNHNENK